MEKRTKLLIIILAVAFFGLGLFSIVQNGASAKQIIQTTIFGLVLITVTIFSLKTERKVFKGKSLPKIAFGSFAMAFALMLLLGVLALPFVGFAGLNTLMGQNTGIIIIILSVLVSPIVAKYIE